MAGSTSQELARNSSDSCRAASLCSRCSSFLLVGRGPIFKWPEFLKLTHTNPFTAWFVVTGDATPDGIRVVRSVLGSISSLPNSLDSYRAASLSSRCFKRLRLGDCLTQCINRTVSLKSIYPHTRQLNFIARNSEIKLKDFWVYWL